jgi:hypothetical protein
LVFIETLDRRYEDGLLLGGKPRKTQVDVGLKKLAGFLGTNDTANDIRHRGTACSKGHGSDILELNPALRVVVLVGRSPSNEEVTQDRVHHRHELAVHRTKSCHRCHKDSFVWGGAIILVGTSHIGFDECLPIDLAGGDHD